MIVKNISNIVDSLKHVIFFMKEFIKNEKFLEAIEFAQLLSKAHFFKWQNRIP